MTSNMILTALPRRLPADIAFNTSPSTLERFNASQHEPGSVPLAIAYPSNEKQVDELVQWANLHDVPLVPVSSSGGPRRRSDTRPTRPSVIVDLSRMNRVIHIDSRDRIAVIEPGVTFSAFDKALRPHGLRAFRPLLPRQGKSVLGAYLEREPMTVPNEHWDSSDPLACLSITFGSGEHFRTGGSSLQGTLEENLRRGNRQMMSSGPIVTDYTRVLLGSQGTLGIVSWASIYCEPIPILEEPCLYGANDYSTAAEMARLLLLRQLGSQCFVMDRSQLAAVVADDQASYERRVSGNRSADSNPHWLLYVNLTASDYLPEQRMAWQRREVDALAELTGMHRVNECLGVSAEALAQRLQHTPNVPYENQPRGQHREVFCLTQLDRVTGLLEEIAPILQSAEADAQLAHGVYVQPMIQGANCQLSIPLFHTPVAASKAAIVESQLVATLAKAGGFFSRPYGAWAEVAYSRDKNIVPHLRRVKQIFDPKGLLNPGRLCF